MALSDWDILKAPPEVTAVINTSTPLVGSGSLDLDNQPLLHGTGNSLIFLRLGAAQPRGFTAGRARTVIKPSPDFMVNAAHLGMVGVFCMVQGWDTPLSFSTGTGKCYIAGFAHSDTGFWAVWKFANGLLPSSGGNSALATGDTTHSPTRGGTYAIELQWHYDADDLGGTRLVFKAKEGTDYTSMTTIYDVVDTSSPLSTSEGEGICLYDKGANSNDNIRQGLYDSTHVLRLIT